MSVAINPFLFVLSTFFLACDVKILLWTIFVQWILSKKLKVLLHLLNKLWLLLPWEIQNNSALGFKDISQINEQMQGGAGTLTSTWCQHYVRGWEWGPGTQSFPALHHLMWELLVEFSQLRSRREQEESGPLQGKRCPCWNAWLNFCTD